MALRKPVQQDTTDFDEAVFARAESVHIERMDGNHVWIGVTDSEGRHHAFDLVAMSKKRLVVVVRRVSEPDVEARHG